MTHIDIGITGAKRATWRKTDTRPLLFDIMQKNPRLTDRELFNLFWDEIEDDKVHYRAIAQYYFDLTARAYRLQNVRPTTTKYDQRAKATKAQEQRQRIDEAKGKIKQRVEHEARIVVMELLMPNGKLLGQCTAADCRKIGGWCLALARRVPAKKTVADVMTEDQVFALWQARGK